MSLPEVGFMKPFSYVTEARIAELAGATREDKAQVIRDVLLYVLNEEKTDFVLFHGHLYLPDASLSETTIRQTGIGAFFSQFLYSTAELHFRDNGAEVTRYLVGAPDTYCTIYVPMENDIDPVRLCSVKELHETIQLINTVTFMNGIERTKNQPKSDNDGISGSYQNNIVTLPFGKK